MTPPPALARRLARHGLTLTWAPIETHGYAAAWRLDGLGPAAWFRTIEGVEAWFERFYGNAPVAAQEPISEARDREAA